MEGPKPSVRETTCTPAAEDPSPPPTSGCLPCSSRPFQKPPPSRRARACPETLRDALRGARNARHRSAGRFRPHPKDPRPTKQPLEVRKQWYMGTPVEVGGVRNSHVFALRWQCCPGRRHLSHIIIRKTTEYLLETPRTSNRAIAVRVRVCTLLPAAGSRTDKLPAARACGRPWCSCATESPGGGGAALVYLEFGCLGARGPSAIGGPTWGVYEGARGEPGMHPTPEAVCSRYRAAYGGACSVIASRLRGRELGGQGGCRLGSGWSAEKGGVCGFRGLDEMLPCGQTLQWAIRGGMGMRQPQHTVEKSRWPLLPKWRLRRCASGPFRVSHIGQRRRAAR